MARRPTAGATLALATLDALAPLSANEGATFELTCTGTGFVDGDVIVFDGQEVATIFGAATTLTAMVTASVAGELPVTVRCADGDTNSLNLSVAAEPDEVTDLDTLMEQLKAGDTSGLASADDNSVISSRQGYHDWAAAERDRLKLQYETTYNAIVAELARRELTGGR